MDARQTMRKRRQRRLLIALAATAAVTVTWVVLRNPARPVETAAVRAGDLVVDWTATGYVEARTANVSSPQVGLVAEILVKEGDAVNAGQPLAKLTSLSEEAAMRAQEESTRAAQSQAEAAAASAQQAAAAQATGVAQAEAQLEAARARQEQAQAALVSKGNAAEANVEAAKAQVAAAQAQLADLQSGARPEEISQAESAVTAAEATAARLRKEKERQDALYREGAVAKRSVEVAGDALVQSEATLKQAREALSILRKGARPQEIAAAKARVQSAEQQAAVAQAQLEGLDAEEHAIEEAAAAVRTAEAGLSQAHSDRKRVEALGYEARAAQARVGQGTAAVQQARAGLAERIVLAPFAGSIGRRFADPGDVASPPQPLFTVVESGKAWVTAEVDAQDIAAARGGEPVAITTPAYPGRTFSGTIAVVGSEAIPQSEARTSARIVRVRISLDATPAVDRPLLKPGMEVDVAGSSIVAPRALQIPNDALLTDADGSYVWVVEVERAAKRRVKAGHASARFTEILSGLRAGEKVVVSGKEGLTSGERVAGG